MSDAETTSAGPARVWGADPVRFARRRGILGLVIVGVLLVAAVVSIPLWGISVPLLIGGVALFAFAVLTLIVSVAALGIARRNPDVDRFSGGNDLASIAAYVVGVVAAVGSVIAAIAGSGGLAIVVAVALLAVVLTASVVLLASANRTAIRAARGAAAGPAAGPVAGA